MTLHAADVSFQYGPRRVLNQVSLSFAPGVTGLVGPNAAGKSTLLKCLCGVLSPTGHISLMGRSIREYSRREISQAIGYLPQAGFHRGGLTVFETVLLGRLHDLSWRISSTDAQCVHSLLEEMALTSVANRMIQELSGGQAQLVAIAQALIRHPSILLLDEPTSNLDLRRQFEICSRIQQITKSRGVITVISLHDLNLAARFADHIAVLRDGAIYAAGTPSDVLTAKMMADVYQVDTEVTHDSSGNPTVFVRGPSLGVPSV
ncbi:ABC transporter ATP-binding protein [Schlesneria paludicola]|uniref:ABC transporter ATP-binding protein n=1 Tax=Schlesneria paludicola TaxID=360056 RepID=UPI00029B13B5|nr:ABC transporter ATP-binding protein [Schlesneria paludicola]